MSLATHRAALTALIGSVPAAGAVHAFERYLRDEAKFREAYLYTTDNGEKHLRGWWIRNTAIRESELGVGRVINEFTWRIRGLRSLQDDLASELEFDQLVEDVRAAFRVDPTLGGLSTAEVVSATDVGIQKIDAGPVLFCGVLCHTALLEVRTREYL